MLRLGAIYYYLVFGGADGTESANDLVSHGLALKHLNFSFFVIGQIRINRKRNYILTKRKVLAYYKGV